MFSATKDMREHTIFFVSSNKESTVALNTGGACGGLLYCGGAMADEERGRPKVGGFG
jgi:hypothetical protein